MPMELKMNKNLKLLVKELLYNSIAQAILRFLFESKHFLIKCFLLVSFLFSTGFSAYLVILSILSYFNYDAITNSRTIVEQTAQFPKITICNANPFITEDAVTFLRNISKFDMFNSSLMKSLNFTEKKKQLQVIYDLALANMNNQDEMEQKKFSHPLEEILIECTFYGQPCNKQRDFSWTYDDLHGNCHEFNANLSNLKEVKNAGADFGLQFLFYTNFNQNLSLFNSRFGSGVVIKVENASLVNGETNYVYCPSGYATYVAVERAFKSYIPKPYSSCDIDNNPEKNFDFSSRLFDLIKHSEYPYNQEFCFDRCYQQELIRKCNCTDPKYKTPLDNGT